MLYTLMNKNQPILKCQVSDFGHIEKILDVYCAKALPVCIPYKDGKVDIKLLNSWWMSRSIPASRMDLRDSMERLGISVPEELIKKCYGLSLSDQYWINPNDSLNWKDVNFFENDFSEDIGRVLCGEKVLGAIDMMSPDNTSDGWLQKKWKIVDGKRILFKAGSVPFMQEPVNELIASRLMERLPDCSHVAYELVHQEDKLYCKCEDFVNTFTEYVPALHILRNREKDVMTGNYEHLLTMCNRFEIPGVQEMLNRMIVVDFILANRDRHWGNFGFIRNVETLEFEGTAPIFDTGSSLFYNMLSQKITPDLELEAKPFAATHDRQIHFVSDFDWLDMSCIYDFAEEVRELFKQSTDYVSDERTSAICKTVDRQLKELDKCAVQSRQGIFKHAEKEEQIVCNYVASSQNEMEKELLQNGFIPTETILSNWNSINRLEGRTVSLQELSELYRNLVSVDEHLRDALMHLGNEFKTQEQMKCSSENILFMEP